MRRHARCPLPVVAAAALAFLTLPGAAQPAPPAPAGEINYKLYCMGCHVADGSGAPGKVPSLRESLPILAASEAGRRYLIEVPGAAQSPLSDRELAQVLNWMIRTLCAAAVPENFADFTATEVGIYRKSPLVDVRGTRARLLAGPAAVTGR